MIKFELVEDVSLDRIAEFMEDKWVQSSYSEDHIWNLNMDDAKEFANKLLTTTEPPHGIVAIDNNGAVCGIIMGCMSCSIAEPSRPVFHAVLYAANGCGVSLISTLEKILPDNTKVAISIQRKNVERFRSFAERYNFIELETIFVKGD